ncbi:glucooligosaccharide oxidase-like protein [Amylocarpus encephaloides]|uniref:Glucooligosaccharide oxidase-like protein n=1 Tax=Amylocarpus encephaloides TaxID=45428 RepID=A0A9P8C3H4_9HELO|nr:glucooligosaccharide oxidase-like protein [Amylocarpus encephaloides]
MSTPEKVPVLTTMYLSLPLLAFLFNFALDFSNAVPQNPRGPRSSVTSCLTSRQVPYSVKGSVNYSSLSTPFNLRLPYQPAVITIPSTLDQVSYSVTCAAAAGLKVQAKGGGHSYASFSIGGQDGSLIIDMQTFSSITVDQSTFVAKIGAGQRLGNVALALYAQGKRALPHGTCPGVGIAGQALHGGYGYGSRSWGLTLDRIVALDVVLANGTQIHTTSTSYPDVFYAMRGAGNSFGIATYLYLSTVPAPTTVLSFSSDFSDSFHQVDIAAKGYAALQNFTLTSPAINSKLGFGVYIDTRGIIGLNGWCIDCSMLNLKNVILPGLISGFPGSKFTIQSYTWSQAVANIAGDPLSQPLGNAYTMHDTFYAKSIATRNSVPLSSAAIKNYLSYFVANEDGIPRIFSIMNLYGGPGSLINTPSPTSSAYSDRDSLWVIQNFARTPNGKPPFDPSLVSLVQGASNAVTSAQPDGMFQGYINYIDPLLTATQAAEQYYGAVTYSKLLGIKTKVDPGFLFWNPQAVGNSMAL